MKFKRYMIGAAVAFLALSSAVLSQSITLPQVSVINPTDLIQIIVRGQPSAQSVYAVPNLLTNTTGYYKSTAGGGATVQYAFTTGVTEADFNSASTINSLYVTFFSSPSDGTRQCVFSVKAVTNLDLCTASTGFGNCTSTAINNRAVTLAALGRLCYTYSASNSTWDRSQ